MHPVWNHLAHTPGSIGALMDPELLRRAVDDADPAFANEHPAQTESPHATWKAARAWVAARLRRSDPR